MRHYLGGVLFWMGGGGWGLINCLIMPNNNKKIIHLILTIYLNYKNKMKKNKKMQQKKLKIAEKESTQADQRKYTKKTEKKKG